MILKGQNVTLKVNQAVIAKSTSCSLNITANTTDASSKDDENPLFDNSEVSTVGWQCTNESFVVSASSLIALMQMFKAGVAVGIEFGDPKGVTSGNGSALLTGLTVNAPNGDNLTVTLSFQGTGKLN